MRCKLGRVFVPPRLSRSYAGVKNSDDIVITALRCKTSCFENPPTRLPGDNEKGEHLVTNGMIEGKPSRGKQREQKLHELTKWLKAGRMAEALKAARDRDAWKVMIAYAKEHGN